MDGFIIGRKHSLRAFHYLINTYNTGVLCEATVLALAIHLIFEMPLATLSSYLVKLIQGNTVEAKTSSAKINDYNPKSNRETGKNSIYESHL